MTFFILSHKLVCISMLMTIHCLLFTKKLEVLKKVLEEQSIILIEWFTKNFMKANPNKFQAICVGKKAYMIISSHFRKIMLISNEKIMLLFLVSV